jgi:hypothetical protein
VSEVGDGGFLSRWSRRKVALREGREPPTPAQEAPPVARVDAVTPPAQPVTVADPAPAEPPPPPAPTLDDVAQLTRQSDFRRFVAPGVDPTVKNAAMKKLFADPHFNVMDGLDTYIDDYGKPDPLPASMLRKMVQSAALGLFDDEKDAEPQAEHQPPPPAPLQDDQDPAVRLQPDDAAGPSGPAGGTRQDPGRER